MGVHGERAQLFGDGLGAYPSTDAALNRRLAIAGLGIMMWYEGHVREALADGQLMLVLKEFCPATEIIRAALGA
jgi:hypothetical protein